MKKFKKKLIEKGYPQKNISSYLTTYGLKQTQKNMRDTYGVSMFSFNYQLVQSCGKDVISFIEENKLEEEVNKLKSLYKTNINILLMCLTSLVFSFLLLGAASSIS